MINGKGYLTLFVIEKLQIMVTFILQDTPSLFLCLSLTHTHTQSDSYLTVKFQRDSNEACNAYK